METNKKNKIKATELAVEINYSVKKDPKVNMFSAGAVALEDSPKSSVLE